MKKPTLSILFAAVAGFALLTTQQVQSHCQVPCGIFADQHRFEGMLEDQVTIAKANTELAKYSGELTGGVTPLALNQAARWVTTKEEHAVKIQETIAQYFMAQRIKPGDDKEAYLKKLATAHAVMQAAMKAKQDPSAEVAETLKKAILDFYRAYEGKEPDFHSHH